MFVLYTLALAPPAMEIAKMDYEHTSPTERLWTPWRMTYIGGNAKEDGCIFCNRLGADDDVRSLILHRGKNAFVIMNLYPYNTGHVMVVPNQHASEPGELEPATLAEIGTLLAPVTRALKRALACQGFNVGLNIGSIAGAGIAAHLHQHVVPRWEGDANFMPILAATMVIPELIPVTYAKLRAELVREIYRKDGVELVVFDSDRTNVLIGEETLPDIELDPDDESSVIRLASMLLSEIDGLSLSGWAGATMCSNDEREPPALTFTAKRNDAPHGRWRWTPIRSISDPDLRARVERAVSQIAG